MPMKPAAALATAPTTKPIAYHLPKAIASTIRIGTPTMAMVRYWRFRNAPAPAAMAAAISFAFSVDFGARSTSW